MAKKISQITQSNPLSGSELFEGVQSSSSVAVSAGRLKRYIEENSFMSGYKNKLINGNFDFWQRGTSQTSNGCGSDDRWVNNSTGTTKTASRQTFTLGQTDVPGNPKYYSRTNVTSSAGAANFCLKLQRIEGVDTFAGETCTLSFYSKVDIVQNIAVEFVQNFGTGGSPSSDVTGIGVTTVAQITSWQKYIVTVDIPSISGKTLGDNGDDELQLIFWLDAGSDYNSRTNSLGQESVIFDLAQVQIEKGSVATQFEDRHISQELALCQRYYQKTYNLDTAPGTGGDVSGYIYYFFSGTTSSTYTIRVTYSFSTTMRSNPSITCYATSTGNINKISTTSSEQTPIILSAGQSSCVVGASETTAGTVKSVLFHLTADAEL